MKKYRKDPNWDLSFLDDSDSLSPLEGLLSATMSEWKEAKHPAFGDWEIAFVNSIAPKACPFCGSEAISRNGKRKDGTQTYVCKACGRRFNPLTGSVLDSRKIALSEWIEFLMHLFEFHSMKSSSRDNRNSDSTGRYWLRKVFAVLRHCQDGITLKGRVYYDETYFRPIECELRAMKNRLSGRIAVGVGYDGANVLALNMKVVKESSRTTVGYFGGRIEPGSVFVHDGNYCHNELIGGLGLIGETHPRKETFGLDDSRNPLAPINEVHASLKDFMRAHRAFDRNQLQDWLNLFAFIYNPPRNRYKKIMLFLEMASKTKEIIRFRKKNGQKR